MAGKNTVMKTKEELTQEIQKLHRYIVQLQKSDLRCHQWIDSIADPVLIFDQMTHLFLDCNQAAIDRYGYSLDELRTMTPHQLHPPEEMESAEAFIERLETPSLHRYTHVTKEGQHVPVEIHTSDTLYRGQSAWISVVRDLSKCREAVASSQENQEKYRAILENIEEGYYEMSPSGDIKLFNESLCHTFGYPANELAGMNYRQLMDDANVQQATEAFDHVQQTNKAVKASGWEISTKTGTKRIIAISISPMCDATGELLGFRGIVRDITDRKQAEVQYEKLLDALEHRTNLLHTAAEVSQAASSILKPEALFPQVVDLVRERFDLYYVGLFLVDHAGKWTEEPGRWAVLRAGTGEAGQQLLKQDHKLELGGNSTVSWAIAHKKARAVSFDDALPTETRSELALPLVDRDHPIGALLIQSTQPSAFSDEDVAALQTMANQLANAITNAHLYDAVNRELAEHKRMEKALRLSEERHRTLIENANEAIFVAQDGELKFVNPQLTEILGFSAETLTTGPFTQFIHPDDREMVQRRHVERLQGQDTPSPYTFRVVDRDERVKWVELNAVAITWENEAATLNFMTDVTGRVQSREEQARAQEALRESEASFQRIVSSITDIVYSVDGETGEFTYLSPSFEKVLGYTMEDIREMGGRRAFLSQVIEGDAFAQQERQFEALKGRSSEQVPTWEGWWRCKDGSRICLEDRSIPIYEDEQLISTDGILRDITERKQAEQALQESETRLRTIVNSLQIGIAIIDAETHQIVDVNPVAADMIQLPEEEIVGHICHQFICPAAENNCPITDHGQQVDESERVLINADGESLPILKTVTPIDLNGQPHLIESFFDITDRQQAEEALRKAHQELAQYTDNLERRTAQLQVGAEVAREAAAILDVQQLLDTVVRLISDRFGFYHAGVFLIDDPGEYAVLRAASSEGGQRMLARSHKLRVGKVGIVGHVAKSGEPRIALDVGEDAVFFDNPDLPDTHSEMGLPLKIRGQIIGVLDVQDTREAAFTEDDVAVLQTLADQLAVALDNARLVERAETQLRELSILYGEYSATTWADLVSQKRSLDYVYDRVDVRETKQIPIPALDQALARGEVIAHIEHQTSEKILAAPLKLHDQIIGSIGIQENNGGQGWSSDEIALIEAVSEQVALALENAQHFAETQKSAQQMRILNEMGQALTTRLNVDGVIAETYWGASRLLDTTNFYIALYDPDADTISFPLSVEEGIQADWPSRQAGGGLTEYIIRHRT
ncbi:MAG TPA: PAS domain S-box protein, partial [Chloroflexi bacterium]|nr:PAS domain S-box protein [Chloroflexota bacterium]